MISYDRLWKILKERKISKTEFRQMIDISTVTLAKMSAGEAVSISIIEKACRSLHCQVEDLVEIKTEEASARWSDIRDTAAYIVQLYYLTDISGEKTQTAYLYGYCIACEEGIGPRRKWELEKKCESGDLEVWCLGQIISGAQVRILLRCIEQEKTLGEYFGECKYTLKPLSGKKAPQWHAAVLAAKICTGKQDYRPQVLLVPGRESAALNHGIQPLHAFGEEPLLCESMVCRDKRALYTEENGDLSLPKMDIIKEVFKREGFLINGMCDLNRIGDFEVFSMPVLCENQKELFSVESDVEETAPMKRMLKGYRIVVFAKYLSGEYLLEVITYNAGNPTLVKLFDILLDGADVVREVAPPETSSSIEVRLFEKNANRSIALVGWSRQSVMRDAHFRIQVAEKQATLEDKYVKKAAGRLGKKNDSLINRRIERYSTLDNHIGDSGNDPWRREFELVQQDFEKISGTERAESVFFANGAMAHEEFLNWFRKKINGSGIDSVWIYDPFIDEATVSLIARLYQDIGIKIHIVTDANAPTRTKADRVEIVKETLERMEMLLPEGLQVYALDAGKPVLHDRLLIMFGKDFLPRVYNMSNSLDNMGMNSPSLVCRLSRETARQAAEYYLGLFRQQEDSGKIKVLWDGKAKRNAHVLKQAETAGEQKTKQDIAKACETFNIILEKENLPGLSCIQSHIVFQTQEESLIGQMRTVICKSAKQYWVEFCWLLCHMEHTQYYGILAALDSCYDAEMRETMKNAVAAGFSDWEREKGKLYGEGLQVRMGQDFRDILDFAGRLLRNPFDFEGDIRLPYTAALALKVLLRNDFCEYDRMLAEFEEKISYKSAKKCTVMLRFAANFLAEEREKSEEMAKLCIQSDNKSLCALGMQYFIQKKQPETAMEILHGTEYVHEFMREYFIALQIERLRGKDVADALDRLTEQWIEGFESVVNAQRLEYCLTELDKRSAADICGLLEGLVKRGKLPAAELGEYLQTRLFYKPDADFKKEDGIWKMQDFADGQRYLAVMSRYCDEKTEEQFLQRLAAFEKKLVKTLHDVFLYHKNYRKWKTYMDILIWCHTMRFICKKEFTDYEKLILSDSNLLVRENEIWGLFKKYRFILEEYSESYAVMLQWEALSDI